MGENIYRIFDGVWNLSLVGGYCVLLVIFARLLLKKAPKWCSYLLWGIVFLRLCCPVLPTTGVSLIPERLLAVGNGVAYSQMAVGQDGNETGDTENGVGNRSENAEWSEPNGETDRNTGLNTGMPEETELYDLAELFKVFGDSTRIKILYVLFESEMCVCDIAALLGMTQSAISHQLRALKNARLVKSRREGKTVFYALADDHVKTIINQGLEHVQE